MSETGKKMGSVPIFAADVVALHEAARAGKTSPADSSSPLWAAIGDNDRFNALLWAEGAPTAGPPPYHVYRVLPHKVLGFPTDDASVVPTRWRF